MLESLKLRNVGPAPAIDMRLGSRMNLLTGDNGLGKSFILDVAWWALTRRWPREINPNLASGYPARPTLPREKATIAFEVTGKSKSVAYESTYSPRDQAWIGKAGRPWNPGLVIYAHADGGFSIWDPHRNYWKTKGNIDVQERLPAYVFSAKEVWDGLDMLVEGTPTRVCNGLLADWSAWLREKDVDAESMKNVMSWLAPPGEAFEPGPLVRLSVNDARDIPSLRLPYAAAVPILYASSGVRRVVALAYMLLWSWREHRIAAEQLGEEPTRQVILLFDEIESHLHPRWQRSILGSVLRLADALHEDAHIQLVAATHSPLVLASAEEDFDPDRDAWFDIDLERSGDTAMPRLRQREFVRHGDVSNWLTSEAFDLKSARSIKAEQAMEQARALLRKNRPTLKQARQVDQALREARLPDIDPFWVRWGAFMERLEGRQP